MVDMTIGNFIKFKEWKNKYKTKQCLDCDCWKKKECIDCGCQKCKVVKI